MTSFFSSRAVVIAAFSLFLGSLEAGDPVQYPDSGGDSKSVLGGKEGIDTLKVNRLKVDLFGSASYIYDSNTTQTPVAQDASIYVFAFGANVAMGSPSRRGVFYGADYLGQVFGYDDVASAFGRDSLEHSLGAFFGVNGGLTRIRVDGDYRRNNGNSLQFDHFNNETRRAQSHDYDFAVDVVRDLPHGSLEFGAGSSIRDFDDNVNLNDGESTFGDLAWFYEPGFAPKTQIGLGFRFGSDNYFGNADQEYITPSVRWRYSLSGKTSLYSSLGYESRSVSGPTGIDSENFVYSGGLSWAATSKSRFDFGYYQNVNPSYVSLGEDVERSGVTVKMNHQLPGRFVLGTQVGFESSDYFNSQTNGANSGRNDDFTRLGVDLSHPLVIANRFSGQWSIFYNYNTNNSNILPAEFDQSIAGFRVGLNY
ncbi:MAG: hypothetical protein ABL994_05360 [Verrucomicrobiales bacterium]